MNDLFIRIPMDPTNKKGIVLLLEKHGFISFMTSINEYTHGSIVLGCLANGEYKYYLSQQPADKNDSVIENLEQIILLHKLGMSQNEIYNMLGIVYD